MTTPPFDPFEEYLKSNMGQHPYKGLAHGGAGLTPGWEGFGFDPNQFANTSNYKPITLPSPPPPPTYHLLEAFVRTVDEMPVVSAVSARYMILVHAYSHILAARKISDQIDFNKLHPIYASSKTLKALAVRTLHKGGLFEPFLVHAYAATVVFGLMKPDGTPGDLELDDALRPYTDWDYLFLAWGRHK